MVVQRIVISVCPIVSGGRTIAKFILASLKPFIVIYLPARPSILAKWINQLNRRFLVALNTFALFLLLVSAQLLSWLRWRWLFEQFCRHRLLDPLGLR